MTVAVIIIAAMVAAFLTYVGIRVWQVYNEPKTLQHPAVPTLEPGTADPALKAVTYTADAALRNGQAGISQLDASMQPMVGAVKVFSDQLAELADADLVCTGVTYQWHEVGFNKHDIWVGVYWKFQELFDDDDGDFDKLTVYICPLPCLLISFTRLRQWQLVPKMQKLDKLCLDCHASASIHPVSYIPANLTDTVHCKGRF